MKAFIASVARNRGPVLLFIMLLVALGLYAATNLPIDAVPDVTNVQVTVVTRAPSLSATEVEAQVTQPAERAMAGLQNLTQVRSVTKFGISVLTIVFDDGTDIDIARARVSERLAGLRTVIPPDVGVPELAPVTTALGEIYQFEVEATQPPRSLEELRTIVEWQIAPRLRRVRGVVEVLGFGGAVKEYRITLDPARLAAHGVSVEDVRQAIERDNIVAGGGFIERAGEQVVLRGDARFRGIEDIGSTVIRTSTAGVPLRVAQLARVDTGPALRQGALTRDGLGETVGASVLMLKGRNSREVVAETKAAIEELKASLPQGVVLRPTYDRADFINRVLGTVTKNLTEGALVVVFCLLLTLGSLRAGLVVAGAIPFSMLFGFMGLKLLGESGNVMSLGAVDFGIIVEGAVVTVEHALAHSAHVPLAKRRRAIVEAMGEVAKPALFVVVITLLVFAPLASLEDVEGKMFRPVVYSLCFMLFGAIIYATMVIPAVSAFLIPAATEDEPAFFRVVRRAYRPMLKLALERPRAVLVACAVVTVGLFATAGSIGADFLPRIFEGTLAVDALRAPSASLTEAIALATETERAALEIPEIKHVVNRIGRPEGAADSAGPESSDVFVYLAPREQWRKGLTPDKLAAELSEKLDKRVPGTVNAVTQPIEMRVNDLVAGVKSDVAVKVFGEDLATMATTADRLRQLLTTIPGASDVKIEVPFGQPSVNVAVSRQRAARLGISPREILDVLQMARAGVSVGEVREGERVFDLKLRLGGDTVDETGDLARLPLTTTRGNLVPLGLAADVREEPTVVQIGREQMRRRITVACNVRGRDLVGFVAEARAAAEKLDVPKSVFVQWGGQFQNFNRAKARLMLLGPVALAVVAIMLVLIFGRIRYTAVTIASLPFAIAGGVVSLVLRELPFSIPAGVGFIALTGIAVCTGVVVTTAVLNTPRSLPPVERVARGLELSLRAPISTALVAALGFVPAAIATGTGAEVQRPLATVVIGGLIIATGLSLLALPAMLLEVLRRDPKEAFRPPIDSLGGSLGFDEMGGDFDTPIPPPSFESHGH
jgi:cobalt-zinc-cadmium resistance protein CzcA